jgi:hypothetical protein
MPFITRSNQGNAELLALGTPFGSFSVPRL